MEVKAVEDNLVEIQSFFKEKNIACETHLLVRGLEPGEDIVRFADENRVDEIIIGVRSRSKVGKLLFGSTAQVVILQASCPVVSVK
jgi:nucleotide-binding universal stress UspA family protein